MTTATPSRAVTLFGREPAAWVGLIEAVLALLVAFALGVTTESAVLVMAAVSAAAGLYTAWATKDTALGAILGLAKATISLAAYYGLNLTDGQQTAIMVLVPVIVGLWQRTQTSPVGSPVDPSPAQVVPVLPTSDVTEALIPERTPTAYQHDTGGEE